MIRPACVAVLVVGRALAAQSSAPPPVDSTWIITDVATKTIQFQLIAGYSGLNGALNFNGVGDGRLTLTVPAGWHVVMHFSNHDGMLPHSAEVIADGPVPTAGGVAAAFSQAVTLKLQEGLISTERDDMKFLADKPGAYLIICGVPGHAAAGMWIRFQVASNTTRPSLTLASAAFLAGASVRPEAERSWEAYDGQEWQGFTSGERRAYLAGFLAGAGLMQAEAAAGGKTADSGRVAAVLDSLDHSGALRYALGGSVYAARLSDFYWWENQRTIRLYLALRSINQGMRRTE